MSRLMPVGAGQSTFLPTKVLHSTSCKGGFEGHLSSILFGRLPPVIHVDGSADQAAVLRWSLDRFSAEMRGNGVGHFLMLRHLAPVMLLQTLRIYLSSSPKEENWEEFAKLANMSRSGFALTFKKKVGLAPMEYLMNWRMQIACELLQAGDQPLSTIAHAVGYSWESAFSVAFQRVVNCRPGLYRKAAVNL